MISLNKRFEPSTSPFCKALVNGDLVLIEQIESAPIDIIEKLIPLCEEIPELKIIKGTEEITYKQNSTEMNKKIHIIISEYFSYLILIIRKKGFILHYLSNI